MRRPSSGRLPLGERLPRRVDAGRIRQHPFGQFPDRYKELAAEIEQGILHLRRAIGVTVRDTKPFFSRSRRVAASTSG